MAGSVTSYDRVNAALENAGRQGKRAGAWTLYNCPAHEDSDPSLGLVYNAAKQRSALRCFTGCDDHDVLAAIGLGIADLYDDARRLTSHRAAGHHVRVAPSPRPIPGPRRGDPLGAQTGPPRIAARYYYRRPDGTAAGRVTRAYIPHEKGTKRVFWQHHWDGHNWARGGFPPLLYHLPEVIAALADGRTIYLVEGEKDADNAARAGLVATCNAMGAGKFRVEHAEQLTGARRVVIVTDRDEAGRRHAAAIAGLLRGRVGSVQIVEAGVGKDLSDHLAAGYGPDDLVPVDHARLAAAGHSTAGARSTNTAATSSPQTEEKESVMTAPDIPTVYTRPDCMQCAATKRTLNKLGTGYQEIDLTTDADARRGLLAMGYTTAPVVIAGDTHFSGYHPDKLAALAESIADRVHGTTPEPGQHIENGVIAADRSSRATASSRPPSWAANSPTSAAQRARRR